MKILQIIYSLASGGAERFVIDLSNELCENGHTVILCTLRNDLVNNNGFYKHEISNKVFYINLSLEKGFRLSNIYAIMKLINEVKPDIVHCHQNLVNYIFPISFYFHKIKYFHTTHNDAPKEVKNKIEYILRRYFYSSQKIKAITISNETSKSFVKFYKTDKYTEIYNGRKLPVSSDNFYDVKKYIDYLRVDCENIFIHIGRCAPQKNQKMLISVFNQLIKDGHSIILLVIGDGFNTIEGKELKSIANNKIKFLGIKHNIADYLLNSDAFCLSSIHEGMPITLIEAMACGCTPICTPVGGISDTIKNGFTGYLSKSISEEDYYEAIVEYLNHKENVLKKNLIDNYMNRFSIELCAKQHIVCYGKEI